MKGFMMRRPDALLTMEMILVATTDCARREYFPSDGDAAAHLREYLTAVMESRPIPGLAVAVVKGHGIIFAEGSPTLFGLP